MSHCSIFLYQPIQIISAAKLILIQPGQFSKHIHATVQDVVTKLAPNKKKEIIIITIIIIIIREKYIS